MKKAVFFLYLLLVIKLIIFKYPLAELEGIAASWGKQVILEGLDTANFIPFHTIHMYIRYHDRLNSFENLAGHVAVFLPFGYLLPWMQGYVCRWRKVLCSAFLFAAGLELFQLFSAFGAFDVDDILLNCAGALVGYLLYTVWKTPSAGIYKKENGFYEHKRKTDRGQEFL